MSRVFTMEEREIITERTRMALAEVGVSVPLYAEERRPDWPGVATVAEIATTDPRRPIFSKAVRLAKMSLDPTALTRCLHCERRGVRYLWDCDGVRVCDWPFVESCGR